MDLPTGSGKHFVYFIEAKHSDKVKIGRTAIISDRLRALQLTNPEPLSIAHLVTCETRGCSIALEEKMHQRFADQRHHGEWFTRTGDLERYLASNPASDCTCDLCAEHDVAPRCRDCEVTIRRTTPHLQVPNSRPICATCVEVAMHSSEPGVAGSIRGAVTIGTWRF